MPVLSMSRRRSCLGRWYEDIDMDYKQAQHCYERAVTLDDDDVIAGMPQHFIFMLVLKHCL